MGNLSIPGIHHITAFADDPQRNVDFYTGVLGLRLVKKTVNFDDPGTYHLYYGDETGSPGTILTFFPWVGSARGRIGNGQVAVTSFAIPPAALEYWEARLASLHVPAEPGAPRFGERALAFDDPDGLRIELVADPDAAGVEGWANGPVPAAHAVRAFHSVTMWEASPARTVALLTGTLGFSKIGEEGPRARFAMDGGPGRYVDVLHRPGQPRGTGGAGTVHHVAWRARNGAEQRALQAVIARDGHSVTDVLDRQYFESIYFREPGGVLFEVATDPPGFLRDEPRETLGQALKLPVWLEPHRAEITQVLPPLR